MATQDLAIDYVNRRDVIDRIDRAFDAYDPHYRETKRLMARGVDHLTRRLLLLQERERNPLWRSQQIASEAQWLLHYTCDWPRLFRRLHDLRQSLRASQRRAGDQIRQVAGPDGAFGSGGTEWFQRWDATTDAVQRAGAISAPLVFLKPVLAPGRLLAYLDRLQVSDIAATGVNRRAELAVAQTAMLQFVRKPNLRSLLADPALWDGASAVAIDAALDRLTQTFEDYLDQTQHPRTGYWGPWYTLGGELVVMHDLSFTFHIVTVRKKDVQRWPQIIATTLEIGALNLDYPYGWRPSDSASPYSNHHNTDVVTLFWYGRAHATAAQTAQIAAAVHAMLDWCLTTSLRADVDGNPYGDFTEVDEYSTIERYAFGVKFLKLVGYWTPDDAFWWDPAQGRERSWPAADIVAPRLLAAVLRLNSDSGYVEDIRTTLEPLVPAAPTAPR